MGPSDRAIGEEEKVLKDHFIIELTVQSNDFNYFLYVAFKQISSLENNSDGINFSKKIRFLLLIVLCKQHSKTMCAPMFLEGKFHSSHALPFGGTAVRVSLELEALRSSLLPLLPRRLLQQ